MWKEDTERMRNGLLHSQSRVTHCVQLSTKQTALLLLVLWPVHEPATRELCQPGRGNPGLTANFSLLNLYLELTESN
jgi:hypothetical protein